MDANGQYAGPSVKVERIHLCRVAGNTVWSHMADDAA